MKKVTGKWNIFAPENYARIYLAEEMGEDHVEWSLGQMAKDSRGWIDLTDTPLFKSSKESKTKAAGYAGRICQMISYAEGRESKPLSLANDYNYGCVYCIGNHCARWWMHPRKAKMVKAK